MSIEPTSDPSNVHVKLRRDLTRYETDGLNDEPMRIGTRGRCYTTEAQRERLDVDLPVFGSPDIQVALLVRTPLSLVEDAGSGGRFATCVVDMKQYGEFTIPAPVREYLNVTEGDYVYVTAAVED
jgi:hypothetical protein